MILGTAHFFRIYGINNYKKKISVNDTQDIIRSFFKKGYKQIDTAPSYNNEMELSKILKNYEKFYKSSFGIGQVINKKDNQMFDRLLDRMYNNISVHELKILEDYSDLSHHNVSDDVAEGSEDTMTLVNNYVDQLTIDLDKDKLKQMIKETFIEAQDSDVVAE